MNYLFKKILLLVFIILACSFLISCKSILIRENEMVIFENKHQIKDEESDVLLNTYIAPQKLEYILNSDREGVNTSVDINASVIMPKYIPSIVSVKPKKITFNQLNSLIDLIAKDENIYHSSYAKKIMTKNKIQSKIEFYNKEISDCNKNGNVEYKSLCENEIEQLYNDLETAPESYADIVLDLEKINKECDADSQITDDMVGPIDFTPDNYNNQIYDVEIGEFYMDNSERLYINATDNIYEQTIGYHSQKRFGNKSIDSNKDFNLSITDAKKMAMPYVNCIDNSFVLLDIWGNEHTVEENLRYPVGYTLVFGRQFNGVDTNYVAPEHSCITYGNNTTENHYPQELLFIKVCENGVYSLDYQSPMEVNDTVNTNPELIDFNKIQEIFNENIFNNNYINNNLNLYINRIELGMMRIDNPKIPDEYLVIPVWDFYGEFNSMNNEYDIEKVAFYDVDLPSFGKSFLTINAIDGSIINRSIYDNSIMY
ncbi:MAG: DUF6034 family protein [Eubacteriaceae bacterium]